MHFSLFVAADDLLDVTRKMQPYHCYEVDDIKDEYVVFDPEENEWTNPHAQWDWWVPVAKEQWAIVAKDGRKVQSALVSEIDWKSTQRPSAAIDSCGNWIDMLPDDAYHNWISSLDPNQTVHCLDCHI